MNDYPKISMCFNASTNVVGGAVQNSANFMVYAADDPDIDWAFIASPQVIQEARKIGFNKEAKCLELTPARSIASRLELLKYVQDKKSSLVYTMAGPAYVRFPVCHVMGCSNPYLTNLDWQSLNYDRSPLAVGLTLAKTIYQAFHIRKADAWIFQTESSRRGFIKRFFVPYSKTDVVPNALGRAFLQAENSISLPSFEQEVITGIYPSAYYPHKAHSMIPETLLELKKKNLPCKVRIKVTIKKGSAEEKELFDYAEKKGVLDCIENIGPFNYVDARVLLGESDFVFFPSVLEVFSTAYIEAIFAKRPLVVADKSFSRELCGSKAFYFRPLSAESAAAKIVELVRTARDHGVDVVVGDELSRAIVPYGERYNKIKQFLLSRIGC